MCTYLSWSSRIYGIVTSTWKYIFSQRLLEFYSTFITNSCKRKKEKEKLLLKSDNLILLCCFTLGVQIIMIPHVSEVEAFKLHCRLTWVFRIVRATLQGWTEIIFRRKGRNDREHSWWTFSFNYILYILNFSKACKFNKTWWCLNWYL